MSDSTRQRRIDAAEERRYRRAAYIGDITEGSDDDSDFDSDDESIYHSTIDQDLEQMGLRFNGDVVNGFPYRHERTRQSLLMNSPTYAAAASTPNNISCYLLDYYIILHIYKYTLKALVKKYTERQKAMRLFLKGVYPNKMTYVENLRKADLYRRRQLNLKKGKQQ